MSLDDEVYTRLDRALADADARAAARYPGDDGTRQPVSTVYVPADRFDTDVVEQWGKQALAIAEAIFDDGAASGVAQSVVPRVLHKLGTEPIEDLRVDFEDGYGPRSDDEEDAAAVSAGQTIADLATRPGAPPFTGIRFKSLEPATRRRGIRTLDLVLEQLLPTGLLPDGFVVTLPKVTSVEQVAAFADICDALEHTYAVPSGRLRFEIQIETPQSILAADGTVAVARMITAGRGRVTGLHYGTYDYSAAVGISAPYQSLDHPAADYAKSMMQLSAAGTGVRLSDGSSNVLPVGSPDAVRSAARLHARLVRRSLELGFYQGWDLHPGQLVTRYAATYAFYRQGMPAACDRLGSYLAGRSDAVLDEPATAQAMAALLVRGLHCGALDEDEVTSRSGVPLADLDALYRRRVG